MDCNSHATFVICSIVLKDFISLFYLFIYLFSVLYNSSESRWQRVGGVSHWRSIQNAWQLTPQKGTLSFFSSPSYIFTLPFPTPMFPPSPSLLHSKISLVFTQIVKITSSFFYHFKLESIFILTYDLFIFLSFYFY